MKEKIAVLGGGTWGCTLANQLAMGDHDVTIWEYNPDVAKKIKTSRVLPTLPQLKLHSSILISNDMKEVLSGRKIILSVTPSHTVRSTITAAVQSGACEDGALVISASKGIENKTLETMGAILKTQFPKVGDIVILSGPSHAEEVAMGQPVALVAASASTEAAKKTQGIFSADRFRIYTNNDPIGVELGGALKNIFAVTCGIADGLQLGDNTKAAIITRGLLEMTRLGVKMGGKSLTFFGLSGLGDMIVTCNSQHSRNRRLGEKIGRGQTLEEALKEMTMVAEGVNTTRSAYDLAKKHGVDAPIINEMYQVLFENKLPKDSLRDLLARQVGAEMEGISL